MAKINGPGMPWTALEAVVVAVEVGVVRVAIEVVLVVVVEVVAVVVVVVVLVVGTNFDDQASTYVICVCVQPHSTARNILSYSKRLWPAMSPNRRRRRVTDMTEGLART